MNLLAATSSDFADIDAEWWAWVGLFALILGLLLVDLLVFHRRAHTVGTKEAAIESSVWIGIGLAFGLVMLALYGGQAAGEYYAGYLIEKSLSIDNVFVWALIFSYFAVPRKFQHRVLFWGIFGALLMRLVFIFAGVALLESFEWLLFVFGGFLIFTGIRLVRKQDEAEHPENNPVLKLVRKVVPSTTEYDGQKLFTKRNAKRLATPLFAVLVLIETTDVVFAVDSVPAVLAVSREQYIVFASNAFAILGLRALYFLLADWHNRFEYLQQGLAVILVYVGIKMIASHWYHVNTVISLTFIGLILLVSILLSLRKSRRDGERAAGGRQDPEEAPPPPPAAGSLRWVGIVDEDIERVRAAVPLVEVVQQFVPMRRVGTRWVGLCPFHAEQTPSFGVNETLGIYKCFGCNAGGDVITFVREMEHLDFVGAGEWLAHPGGVQLRYTSGGEGRDRQRLTVLVDAMAGAVEWYHHRLLEGPDAR